jgi:prolyl-tRNA synthetase
MGWKLNEWELKGVPLIIIVGAQEFEKGQITLKFRDVADKQASTLAELNLDEAFNAMHERLYTKANQRMQEQIVRANTLDEFKSVLEQNKVALVPFFDDSVMEKKIDTDFGVGTRCLIDAPDGSICVFSGKATTTLAYFSKSY